MWQTKMGTCIYTSPSGYKVYQNLFYRWLTLGSNALQTVISKRTPRKPILYYLPALTLMARLHPGAICLLGLGGAGIPLMLYNRSLIAVDNSEEVIDIARRFFMADSLTGLTIVHDNAMDYVQNCPQNFSHVLVDLYDANHFPAECAQEAFFSSCHRIITEDGFFAINLANLKEQSPLFQLIRKQFKHTFIIPIKNSANMVIYAVKSNNLESFIRKMEQTGAFKRIIWVDSWGYVGEYK